MVAFAQEKTEDKKTGKLRVTYVISGHQRGNTELAIHLRKEAEHKLGIMIAGVLADGREYSLKRSRSCRPIEKCGLGPDDWQEEITVVVALVRPADCKPGEWCIAYAHDDQDIPYSSRFRPVRHIPWIAERVY